MVAPTGSDSVDPVGVPALEGPGGRRHGGTVEEVLGDLDSGQVGDDEGEQYGEEPRRERREAEGVVQRALGNQSAGGDDGNAIAAM